ncbi:histidyl-tRNA synthetase [Cryptosporidium ryanae]|uniref:histidyl-tRNA synthetase n=1 Tax=Cryptosporidium ryanae TaxID=515981 RepID=UPI00351A6D31|nr:histidyl-tRNA synthetase [Cryptosporidium ryanae]
MGSIFEERVSMFVDANGISVESISEVSTNSNIELVLESRLSEDTSENVNPKLNGDVWTIEDNLDLRKPSRELDVCETRALIIVKATNMAMNKNISKKILIWLIDQLKRGPSIPFRLKYFDSDRETLSYLLYEYLKSVGECIPKTEGEYFVNGFSATHSQLGFYLGVCSSLRYYIECVIALLMESMSYPLCFLAHISALSTEGLLEVAKDIRWLLEDSKIQRESKWTNKSLGIKLINVICSLGNFQNSIESSSKCLKRFLSKSSTTVSYKGIENSINYIELMPIMEPIRGFMLSLVSLRKSCFEFLEELVPTVKESITPLEYSNFELDKQVSVKGLDISQIMNTCEPIKQKDIEYLNLKIDYFKKETETIKSHVSVSDGLEENLSGIILSIKKLIDSNLEMFTILNLVSLQELSGKNLLQYTTNVEKAKKKGKTEITLSSHESRNIHAFRVLMLDFISKIDNNQRLYEKLFGGLRGSSLYKLFRRLKLISTPQNQILRIPKIPKGTQDVSPYKMSIKNLVFENIKNIYRVHGAVEIDTPVFELKETLLGKYGEDSKLIYDLKDQGGEQLSLRYDLTVPLARYIATSGLDHIKRFQIGKVYRRDEPQMSRGRFREFYQCDLDIVGKYDLMVADAEIINIATEVLSSFSNWIGKFIIKVNHRQLLNGILEISGVPSEKFKMICSSIDKLDKETWVNVKHEMINIKGLSTDSADKIGKIINMSGKPLDLINTIKANNDLISNCNIEKAISDLELLFKYTHNCIDYLSFDLSLARGLDYYTGVIYEAVIVNDDESFKNASDSNYINVGTIAAGGRYDELIGMFSQKSIPAVGFSVGVERIMSIIEKKLENSAKSPNKGSFTDFLICNIGDSYIEYRFKVASLLWKNHISCEISYIGNGKLRKQLDFASNNNIPYCIIIGEDEFKKNTVQIKLIQNNNSNNEGNNTSKEIEFDGILNYINNVLFSTSISTYSKFKSEFTR